MRLLEAVRSFMAETRRLGLLPEHVLPTGAFVSRRVGPLGAMCGHVTPSLVLARVQTVYRLLGAAALQLAVPVCLIGTLVAIPSAVIAKWSSILLLRRAGYARSAQCLAAAQCRKCSSAQPLDVAGRSPRCGPWAS